MKLYDRLPKELIFVRELMLSSLWRAPEHWEFATVSPDMYNE
jgi:phosphoenolpyruvate carboxykinase (GTP)